MRSRGLQVFHEEMERFLPFGYLPGRQALLIRHGLGQLEIAIVVEHGIERHGRTSGGLQVREVLQAAPGAAGQFLGIGDMLAAVSHGFGLLLEESQFLEVMRRQADEMALAGDGDLQRLPNPPGRVGCKAGAVTDVEAVNSLHEAADSFLQQIAIAQGMVPEPLGDVGSQADIGRRQPMLVMHIAILEPANGQVQCRPYHHNTRG